MCIRDRESSGPCATLKLINFRARGALTSGQERQFGWKCDSRVQHGDERLGSSASDADGITVTMAISVAATDRYILQM